MPLYIKNRRAESLARKVADETGESLTETIQVALKERWQRLRAGQRRRRALSQIDDILRRVDLLPELDKRAANEILGYDDLGMPR